MKWCQEDGCIKDTDTTTAGGSQHQNMGKCKSSQLRTVPSFSILFRTHIDSNGTDSATCSSI